MWYLVFFIWIALLAGIFWVWRSKRSRAVGERAKQLDALLAEARLAARVAADAGSAGLPAMPEPALTPATVAPTAEPCLRKPRLLGQADALLYRLFRAGLPDHELFANVAIADVVEPAASLRGYERDQSARKLALHRINLVVCSRQLEVVAAVLLTDAAADAARIQFAEACLAGAGIRVLRLNTAALPRHHQIRALVYDDTAGAA
jgi:hypothetical protein